MCGGVAAWPYRDVHAQRAVATWWWVPAMSAPPWGSPGQFWLQTWQEAEACACAWMRHVGFVDARLTGDGADGGVDVYSTGAVAQVKFKAQAVGTPDLQRLFGARGLNTSQWCLFFTGASYSRQALEYASVHSVALFVFDQTGQVSAANPPAQVLLDSTARRLRDKATADRAKPPDLSGFSPVPSGPLTGSPPARLRMYDEAEGTRSLGRTSMWKRAGICAGAAVLSTTLVVGLSAAAEVGATEGVVVTSILGGGIFSALLWLLLVSDRIAAMWARVLPPLAAVVWAAVIWVPVARSISAESAAPKVPWAVTAVMLLALLSVSLWSLRGSRVDDGQR